MSKTVSVFTVPMETAASLLLANKFDLVLQAIKWDLSLLPNITTMIREYSRW